MNLSLNVSQAKELSNLGANQLKSRDLRTEADFSVSKNDFAKQLELKQAGKIPREVKHHRTGTGKREAALEAMKEEAGKAKTKNEKVLSEIKQTKIEELESELKKSEASSLSKTAESSAPKETQDVIREDAEPEVENEEVSSYVAGLQSVLALLDEILAKIEEGNFNSTDLENNLSELNLLFEKTVQQAKDLKDHLSMEELSELPEVFQKLMEGLESFAEENNAALNQRAGKAEEGLQALKELASELRIYETRLTKRIAQAEGAGRVEMESESLTNLEETTSDQDGLMTQKERGADKLQTPFEGKKAQNEARFEKTIPTNGAAAELGGDRGLEANLGSLNLEQSAEIEQNQLIQTKLSPAMKMDVFEQVKSYILRENAGQLDRSEMVIRLKPEELGRLELKIELHNDEVTAKFNVASQAVKEALEANLEDLKMALKDRGFEITNLAIDVREGSKEGRSGGEDSSKRSRSYFKNEAQQEDISLVYQRSLEATVAESTFEHLA